MATILPSIPSAPSPSRLTARCRCVSAWRSQIYLRWRRAAALYRAVMELLDRKPDNVLVMGPAGRAKVVPRAVAERLAQQGRLGRVADLDAAREAMGLPPAIGVTADSDHTGGRTFIGVPPRHALTMHASSWGPKQ